MSHGHTGLEHTDTQAIGAIEGVIELQGLVGSSASHGKGAGDITPVAQILISYIKFDDITSLEDIAQGIHPQP